MRGHCRTKTDDNPLDGFRDSLTSSHGGGETVKGWFVFLMVTRHDAESCSGSTKLHVDIEPLFQ